MGTACAAPKPNVGVAVGPDRAGAPKPNVGVADGKPPNVEDVVDVADPNREGVAYPAGAVGRAGLAVEAVVPKLNDGEEDGGG